MDIKQCDPYVTPILCTEVYKAVHSIPTIPEKIAILEECIYELQMEEAMEKDDAMALADIKEGLQL